MSITALERENDYFRTYMCWWRTAACIAIALSSGLLTYLALS